MNSTVKRTLTWGLGAAAAAGGFAWFRYSRRFIIAVYDLDPGRPEHQEVELLSTFYEPTWDSANAVAKDMTMGVATRYAFVRDRTGQVLFGWHRGTGMVRSEYQPILERLIAEGEPYRRD